MCVVGFRSGLCVFCWTQIKCFGHWECMCCMTLSQDHHGGCSYLYLCMYTYVCMYVCVGACMYIYTYVTNMFTYSKMEYDGTVRVYMTAAPYCLVVRDADQSYWAHCERVDSPSMSQLLVYMCVYVCICMYMCVRVCVYVSWTTASALTAPECRRCLCVCVYVCICMYMYVCECVCVSWTHCERVDSPRMSQLLVCMRVHM
jgi:hypothetical protein